MLAEFRKSINSVLYERVVSPFYGTLFISWLIWNWKIWYLTFFVNSEELSENKINYIVHNYNDLNLLLFLPLGSTIALLTVIPFVTNGAYWLDLKFKTWRVNQKHSVESKQLLTLEQSIKLRKEIREQEESFDKLLEKKNSEISSLQMEIEDFRSQQKEKDKSTETDEVKTNKTKISKKTSNIDFGTTYTGHDYNMVKENKDIYPIYSNVIKHVMDEKDFPDMKDDLREFLLINEYVQEKLDAYGNKFYDVTFKGRSLYREFFNERIKK